MHRTIAAHEDTETADVANESFRTPHITADGQRALLGAIELMTLSTDACRIFHGRGGVYPGCEHLTLDWFPPVLLLTSFKELQKDEVASYGTALSDRWSLLSQPDNPINWIYQCRDSSGPQRANTQLMAGEVPEPHIVSEGDNRYLVHLLRGQNHGLFLDMANGREWLQQNCCGEKVLNLFAYTCAFSVAALAGGGTEVVNVDMSRGALSIGKRNHDLNGLKDSGVARFLGHNIFKSWGKIRKLGPYGVIVVDPPSYQKGSFVATKDYAKIIRRLPSLLRPGGRVLLCLNAPELDTEFLRLQVADAAPQLHFIERLKNPPNFEVMSPERALKVLLYEMAE